jgi:hypothetical protein
MDHGIRSSWKLPTAAIVLLLGGCVAGGSSAPSVRVSDVTLFGDLECFRIETPAATYLYGKRGAGFAGILDPDGHDWISYHHGGKAAGEYRGLPKCGQPVKFFHCGYGFGQYSNDNPFTSRVVEAAPDRVRIASESKDGRSACDWEFTPTHATFTLRRIGLPTWWFLYEGAPGGALQAEGDVVIRPGGRRTTLAEPWEDDIPWACFGSVRSPYALLLVSRSPAVRQASYVAWPYKPEADGAFRQMTVFGWGRLGWRDPKQHEPQLRELPGTFSLALVRGTDPAMLDQAVLALSR